MRVKSIVVGILVGAGLLAAPSAYAQKHKVEYVNASTTTEGEKLRGPRSIRPTHVNRIRYRVEVKTKAKFTDGPSLALPFIPQIPGGGGGGDDKGADAPDLLNRLKNVERDLTGDISEQEFQNAARVLDDWINFRASRIQNPISRAIASTNRASAATRNFVLETNALLAGQNGPQTVLGRLANDGPLMTEMDEAFNQRWPDDAINTFLSGLSRLENSLARISDREWLVRNKDRVDGLLARIKTQRDEVTALSHNDDADGKATKFDAAQQSLSAWRDIFTDARTQGEPYFNLPYVEAGCGFAFDQNKETEVILVKQDRLAPADSEPAEQALVTVICSSPLSISGGFAMSRIDEREFVFVPSTKTVTENGQETEKVINRFGFKNNSSFRMLPVLLLNTRLHEWNDTYALHMSAGAAVDIKTGEAGTDVEFLVGPSLSFKRSMFITGGVHFGRVPKLAGGFEVGAEVPDGIDQPPVEKAWKPGFVLGITFKLK